jgi:hypothetical protein
MWRAFVGLNFCNVLLECFRAVKDGVHLRPLVANIACGDEGVRSYLLAFEEGYHRCKLRAPHAAPLVRFGDHPLETRRETAVWNKPKVAGFTYRKGEVFWLS